MQNFGITRYGNHAIIKLNCVLDDVNHEFITSIYGSMIHIFKSTDKRGTTRTKFEGCLPQAEIEEFMKQFRLAHKRTKLNKMAQEIENIESFNPEQDYAKTFCTSMLNIDEDELPF